MCCFSCTADVDEVRVHRRQHAVQTLGTKWLDFCCLVYCEIIPNSLHDYFINVSLKSAANSASCLHDLPENQQLCWITVLLRTKTLTGFPIEGSDREDGCGRTQHSVCYGRGSGISQTRQLLIPNPDSVRTLPAPQILVPLIPLRPPASRRESISHTCRGYSEKIHTGERSLPRFGSQSFQGGKFVLVFWFWTGGGVRIERKARKERLSGQLAHVARWISCSGGLAELQSSWIFMDIL